jgi:hypothetical protein
MYMKVDVLVTVFHRDRLVTGNHARKHRNAAAVAVPLLDPRTSLIGGIGGIGISGPWWASRADHRLPLCWRFPDDMRDDILPGKSTE